MTDKNFDKFKVEFLKRAIILKIAISVIYAMQQRAARGRT